MLLLKGIGLTFRAARLPRHRTRGRDGPAIAATRGAFAASCVFRILVPHVGTLGALTEHPRAVRIFKFHEMMVENLAMFFGGANLATAHAVRTNRIRAFDPIANVDVVAMLFDDVVAR